MEITTNKQILGLRIMQKHHTVYEVQGSKGLNNFQISEAKKIYADTKDAKLYALTTFYNSAFSRTDNVWIEVNISDL
jgi:hypothetical protein